MSDELDYSEFEQFAKAFEKWPEFAIEAAGPAMMDSLLFLHGKLPDYPDPPATGVGFVNAKQRAWFFAAVQDGSLKGWKWVDAQPATDGTEYIPGHPEKTGSARTGNLGRKFTEDVKRQPWMVIGQLGTNVAYAPWVVGPDFPGESINGETMYQARIHAGRWWQFYEVVDKNTEGAFEEFAKTFWPEFDKRIGGTNA